MQDFEPTYEYSIAIIRNFLHLITEYPLINRYLTKSVYLWVANPFSKKSNTFQNWMDVVWIAALCKIPFSHIRHSVTMYLFHILSHNYNPTEEKMEKIDRKTYLKRVFNEGRNRNASRELLYTIAFSGMIYSKIVELGSHINLVKLIDKNHCYLPDDCLISVWREMKEVNDNIISLEPREGPPYIPGLFKHLGLGDKNSDIPTTIEQIYKFLNYCRSYGTILKDIEVDDFIVNFEKK